MNATLTAPAKFDRRAIALAAWALVKTAGKTLSEGMKAAWSAAKAPAAPAILEIQVAYAGGNALYGQYNTLLALGAQGLGLGLNASQFQKRVNYFVADEAIAALRAGQQVRFVK